MLCVPARIAQRRVRARTKLAPISICSGIALAVMLNGPTSAAVLGTWTISTLTTGSPGVNGQLPAASTAPNVSVGSLSLGPGLTTQSAASTFGAKNWGEHTNEADAITGNDFIFFSLTADTGFTESFSSISPYNVRRSGTGPNTGIWQYEIGAGNFVDIGSAISWGSVTAATGNAQPTIDLSSISDLQNVAAGTPVTFRIVNWGDSGSAGTWYLNGTGTNGGSLAINGSINPAVGSGSTLFWDSRRREPRRQRHMGCHTPAHWSASDSSISPTNWDSSKTAVLQRHARHGYRHRRRRDG